MKVFNLKYPLVNFNHVNSIPKRGINKNSFRESIINEGANWIKLNLNRKKYNKVGEEKTEW